jgi:inosine-uridine nucleoside N-ribohydrolase
MRISRRGFIGGVAASSLLTLPFSAVPKAEGKIPVLFDTDIGDDIDDAVCLAYLLSQPACELLGVTTEFGSNAERARLVSAFCMAAGREDVPIHAGKPYAMDGRPLKAHPSQATVLADWPHRKDFEEGTAVEFLYETIMSRPGRITLLAVGPLTNVGRLFKEHPDAARNLARVVLMNGHFRAPVGEWNAIGDKTATRVVYETRLPSLTSVGLDVTLKCRIPAGEARERFKGGVLDLVAEMAEVWFDRAPVIIFHDPLAAVSIFEPDVLTCKDVKVFSRNGLTLVNPFAGNKPHRIATGVDKDRFFEHYFDVVGDSN